MEKIYEVEFMSYTNSTKDAVSNMADEVKNIKYINLGKDPFLIKESDFEKYRKFGNGFRTVRFVGNMELT